MYVAVKGGERAIEASHRILEATRRGATDVAALGIAQIREQLSLLVARVMAEASVYSPDLAALAIKQACGDPVEAAFLLRAYRTTLPRFCASLPLDTEAMRVRRRVSAISKDLPGGQLLGATFDYTQRLLDFSLVDEPNEPQPQGSDSRAAWDRWPTPDEDEQAPGAVSSIGLPDALTQLAGEGLIEAARREPGDPEPPDVTRDPPGYPMPRAARLQMLARADEGWALGMAYSTQRGYAVTHPFAGEIRHGAVPLRIEPEELGFAITIGELELTECQMVNQFVGSAEVEPTFTRGYGLALGSNERRAMSIALLDRAMRGDEFGERRQAPAQDQEFTLAHGDCVEASGFVQHLKLPHYVTFESEPRSCETCVGRARRRNRCERPIRSRPHE
ncbi:MAG: carbon-phosphorus lyase complex subunit PhnI [Burkholderiaceae bacterium]